MSTFPLSIRPIIMTLFVFELNSLHKKSKYYFRSFFILSITLSIIVESKSLDWHFKTSTGIETKIWVLPNENIEFVFNT